MMFDVVTFGEALGSIRAAGLLRHGGAMTMSLAGAESNVAIGLARLGHRVRWAGRVGADEVGSLVLRTLRAENVNTAAIRTDQQRPTGIMLVEKRVADLSRVAYYRAASAGSALQIADVRDAFTPSTRILHLTGITPALSLSAAEATLWAAREARRLGVLVSFDVNYRAALWSSQDARALLSEIAATADVIFASEEELHLIAAGQSEGSRVRALLAAGAREVVLTRGGDGASAHTSGSSVVDAARPVPVVDTIGAGDAFTAGYLSGLLDGLELRARLDRGSTLGAFAVSGAGDWESLPLRSELDLLDRAAGATLR